MTGNRPTLMDFDEIVLPDPETKFCAKCGRPLFLADHRPGLTVWLCPGYMEKYHDHANKLKEEVDDEEIQAIWDTNSV